MLKEHVSIYILHTCLRCIRLSCGWMASFQPLSIRVSGSVPTLLPPGWAAVSSPSLHLGEWQCAHLPIRMSSIVLTLSPSGNSLGFVQWRNIYLSFGNFTNRNIIIQLLWQIITQNLHCPKYISNIEFNVMHGQTVCYSHVFFALRLSIKEVSFNFCIIESITQLAEVLQDSNILRTITMAFCYHENHPRYKYNFKY